MWCPQYGYCPQAVEQQVVRFRDKSSDRRILELASQDIGIIKGVVTDLITPMIELRTAKHLNEAYQEYMRSLRVVDKARPWENAPMSKVHGRDYCSL